MNWNIYLSGEIHTDWRDRIAEGIADEGLPVTLHSPVTDHASSDDCGDNILGAEEQPFWKDHKASKINAIRTRKLIEDADVVVVRFGDKYRQWNAAFDAGYAADQFGSPGTASFAMAMLDEGTKKRSALEISEELQFLGATLTTGSNPDASYVTMSTLVEKLDESLDVLADVVLNPSFPPADVERGQFRV